MNQTSAARLLNGTILLAVIGGCVKEDGRLIELSEKSAERQAEQNRQIAQQSQKVAEATQALVAADSQARKALIAANSSLNEQLHSERASLDRQHEHLEEERRALSKARNREPVIAAVITSVTLLLMCGAPLLVVIYLLRALSENEPGRVECEVLVAELLSDPPNSSILSNQLSGSPAPALPSLDDE